MPLVQGGKTWRTLDKNQCKELLEIIQNFESYDPQDMLRRFIESNGIKCFKKITKALSSKENFIKILKKLCKGNENIIHELAILSHKNSFVVQKKDLITNKISQEQDQKSFKTTHRYPIISALHLNKICALTCTAYNRICAQTKQYEIQFNLEEINFIFLTSLNICISRNISIKEYTEQNIFSDKVLNNFFLYVLKTENNLKKCFDLSYSLSVFIDQVNYNNISVQNILADVTSILRTQKPENISQYLYNLFVLKILFNTAILLDLSNQDLAYLEREIDPMFPSPVENQLQSTYHTEFPPDDGLPPIE